MNNDARHNGSAASKQRGGAGRKRPYRKPDFKHEKVFETMALSCGKLSATQMQCRFNRRNS